MISQRPRETTETNIEWIGELPSQWSVGRIKNTSYLKARVGWKGLTSDEFKDSAYAYLVTGTDFRQKFVEWSNCYQVDQSRFEDDPFIQLQNGDLLITKDGTIGKLAMVSGLDKPACLNSGIFVVRPNFGFENEFMYWVLSSNLFSIFCDLESFGSTINHLYQNVFERFQFPMPLISEQRSIARYLDTETEKIDALVAEQRRLIQLLKEKRQAVISHAVTKGLYPDAPMKPSGIEWLGDVPDHWGIANLKTVSSFVTSGPRGWSEKISEEGSLFVQSGDLDGDLNINFRRAKRVQVAEDAETMRTQLVDGDVVICITGAKTGNVAICTSVPEVAYVNQHLCLVRPTEGVLPEFLAVSLKSELGQTHFSLSQYGLKQGLSLENVKCAPILVPPIQEQRHLLGYIGEATAKVNSLICSAEAAIALLQERRTALISAAVTGKIDVRTYQPDQAA